MNMDTKFQNDYADGYRDGVRYHIDGDFSAKDHDRYMDEPGYEAGFDQAGDDS